MNDLKRYPVAVLGVILLVVGGMFAVFPPPSVLGQSSNGNRSTATGSGTVSANNGSAGAIANYAAAGGSTTVGPDATLVDNGTNFTVTSLNGIVLPNGASATPTLRFAQYATNTGFFSGAATNFVFAVTGTNQLNFTNAGILVGSANKYGWTSTGAATGTIDTTLCRQAAGVLEIGSNTGCAASGNLLANLVTAALYATVTDCASSASPAVCAAAPTGAVAIATGTVSETLTVNTTAVTANSEILLQVDETLGTKLGVTCDSTLTEVIGGVTITARTATTSFQITHSGNITTNPLCLSYTIIN